MQLIGNLLGVEAALFHTLQGRGQGENGLFHGEAAGTVQGDFHGFERGEFGLDFFDLGCGDIHAVVLLYL